MSHSSDIREPLLQSSQKKAASSSHHVHSGKGGNGTLLSRIEDVKTSKQFLEECTYFVGLKGKYR
jgi:hypothetical protein